MGTRSVDQAYLAAAFCGVVAGAALVASGAAVADVGSGLLGFLRYAIALVCMAPLIRIGRMRRMTLRDLAVVSALGIGQFGVLIAFLNYSVLLTTPARAGLIFATLPLMSLVIVMALGRSVPGPGAVAAIFLTLAGIVCLLGLDALVGALTANDIIGMVLAAIATFVGALCSVLYGPQLQRYGVVQVSSVAMLASLPPLGLLALVEPGSLPMAQWPPANFWLVLFVGLGSGTGYVAWLFALTRTDATRATAFLALSPVTAGLLSVWLLGDPATPGLLTGILLVSAGLLVLALGERRTAYSSQ